MHLIWIAILKMNHMKFKLLLFSIITSQIFFSSCKLTSRKEEIKRPNVLVIMVDDMNGYAIRPKFKVCQTPNLDKLAKQGVNFINASCNATVCTPSRASFFSGLYPYNNGVYLSKCDGWRKSEILGSIRNLPELFGDNGYLTWACGKVLHSPIDETREKDMWDNYPIPSGDWGPFPEEQYWYGGDRYSSVKDWEGNDSAFHDVVNADLIIDFLGDQHDKPFFAYYGLWRPHNPYTAPKRFFDLYDPDSLQMPYGLQDDDLNDVPKIAIERSDSLKSIRNDTIPLQETWRKFLHGYYANTTFADWNIGRVIEALDKSKYADNTIVVFFSDNGFHCGEKLHWGKSTLWEMSANVPLILRAPDYNGRVCSATVSLVDIFPTLLEYCNIPSPEHKLDGQSLLPLIDGRETIRNKPAISVYGIGYSGVRTPEYHFIAYPDGSNELYDHRNDIHEFNNLVGLESSDSVINNLSTFLPANWYPSTGGRMSKIRPYEKKVMNDH